MFPKLWSRFWWFGEDDSAVEVEEKTPWNDCSSSWLYLLVCTQGCVCVCVFVHTHCISRPAEFHLHGQFNGKLARKCSISYFMNLIGFSWFYKVLQPDTHGWRLHSRRPKTLHLCFSTLARIHWIWSGMTMHLWNVHSLFSCLIQIKKGGGEKRVLWEFHMETLN